MIVYAVLLPHEQPDLVSVIQSAYAKDHLRLHATQWLVAASGSVLDVSKTLHLSSDDPNATLKNIAVVFATSSYFGRASPTVWDWIKVKLEGQPHRG